VEKNGDTAGGLNSAEVSCITGRAKQKKKRGGKPNLPSKWEGIEEECEKGVCWSVCEKRQTLMGVRPQGSGARRHWGETFQTKIIYIGKRNKKEESKIVGFCSKRKKKELRWILRQGGERNCGLISVGGMKTVGRIPQLVLPFLFGSKVRWQEEIQGFPKSF